ncbi:MAG: TlpA family protein disulfide reductase [Clostridia bacterium]|nr:TlpA family protein disulfide reductase [Clostridia bacterium]
MKQNRLFVLITLLAALLLPLTGQAASIQYKKGDTIQDFSFTTYTGQQYSIYEVLKEKDAILLNIWASWCGPCRREFPFMQEAYEEYRDQVEIIALSCESTDTPDKLESFAQENGLTFLIGQAPEALLEAVGVSSIPVSLMIDRYGTICFMEAGAQPDTDSFRRLFDAFVGKDYQESLLLASIPSEKPDVAASSPEELYAALGCAASNPTGRYTWPMITTEKDGRQVVVSTNAGKSSSRAEIIATVEAKAGNAIVITFKTSTEELFDLLAISLNGKTVKHFGGDQDWMSYAIPVETEGTQTVKLAYIKDHISDAGEDTVWVDNIDVAEDAQSALAGNPVYPVADATLIIPTGSQAKEVVISDPMGLLAANFGQVRCYVVNEDVANVDIRLSGEVDPECALVYFSYDKAQYPVKQLMTAGGYAASTKIDAVQTTGGYCTFAAVYPDVRNGRSVTTLLFRDEDNLDSFVTRNALGDWTYAESAANTPTGPVVYAIKCIDQDGVAIAGAMIQVCSEEICQVYMTGADGTATFEADAYPWEIHVLQAPDGYTADPSQVVIAPVEGGEVTIELMKK